jgi:hypothetical protein
MAGSGSGWMYGASPGLVVGATGSGKGWMNGAGCVVGAGWAWAGAEAGPAASAASAADKPHVAIHVHLTISATPCTRSGLQASDSRLQGRDGYPPCPRGFGPVNAAGQSGAHYNPHGRRLRLFPDRRPGVTDLLSWRPALYSVDAHNASPDRGFRLQTSGFRKRMHHAGLPLFLKP